MEKTRLELFRGTLDILILKSLIWGPLHGYAITSFIRHQSDEALLVEEGTLYPALWRLESKSLVEAEWGLSDNNRKAKYYRLTAEGRMTATGQAADVHLTNEETLPVKVGCSIHPWMRAYMMPRKDKYFAVTKPDGTFEIPNLPAGEELELQVWHERAGGPAGALVLQNPDLKWTNKGRFKVKLEPDQTKELALDVPAAAFK